MFIIHNKIFFKERVSSYHLLGEKIIDGINRCHLTFVSTHSWLNVYMKWKYNRTVFFFVKNVTSHAILTGRWLQSMIRVVQKALVFEKTTRWLLGCINTEMQSIKLILKWLKFVWITQTCPLSQMWKMLVLLNYEDEWLGWWISLVLSQQRPKRLSTRTFQRRRLHALLWAFLLSLACDQKRFPKDNIFQSHSLLSI